MFSAKQLAKFAGCKRISQETFDAAVQENIDEFDMEPEEALKSAIDELTAQGVDLSNIIKTLSGGDISTHPAALAVQRLAAARGSGDADSMAAAATGIEAAVSPEGGSREPAAEALAVLHTAGATQALAECLQTCSGAALLAVLHALAALLGGTRELQADFLAASGVAALQQVLASQASSGSSSGDVQVVAAALHAAAATGAKNEEGKAALMAAGMGASSIEVLRQHPDQPEVLQASCALLCTLTSADDDTQPASRAFPNARALAKEGAARQLVEALRGHEVLPAETTSALATALKLAAANDEICQEVLAVGGVQLGLEILKAGLADASLARPLCSLLRQLASSDVVKAQLLEGGCLELLGSLLAAHGGTPGVLEQGVGLLTNMTLRNPEAAAKALECGCLDAVLELMRAMVAATTAGGNSGASRGSISNRASANGNSKESRANTGVQRQACMTIRNIAVRNPEVRAALLERGAEALLREVKVAYPGCADAGSAALRDLGLDNYN